MILKQKDWMWYTKSTIEAVQVGVACICFIGFVFTMIMVVIAIPMVWGKPISYHPFPWLNPIAGFSMGVGLLNFVIIISSDKEWRRSYRDNEDAENFD